MPTIQISIGSDVIAALTGSPLDAVLTLHLVLDAAPAPRLPGGGADLSADKADLGTQPARPSLPLARGPLADLLRGGVLSAGDRLRLHQPRARRTAHATVQEDGTLLVDGHGEAYTSPSAAAAVVTGSQINGWSTWHRESDGRTLDQLRLALRDPDEAT